MQENQWEGRKAKTTHFLIKKLILYRKIHNLSKMKNRVFATLWLNYLLFKQKEMKFKCKKKDKTK